MAKASTKKQVAAAQVPQADPVTVFDHLLVAIRTDIKNFAPQDGKEDDRKFLLRMIDALSKVDEKTFDAMPDDAQNWYNNSAQAEQEGKEWAGPDGFISAFQAPKPAKEAKPEKPTKEAKPEKPAKAEKEPKVRKERERKTDGKVARCRRLVLKNLDASMDALMKTAEGQELGRSTLAVTHGWIQGLRADLKALGMTLSG